MYKKLLLILITCLTLFQCKPTSEIIDSQCININVPSLLKSTEASDYLLDEFEYIRLETSDDCLIGEIQKVEIADNKIVILTSPQQSEILIFDREGHYIHKILRGRGPDEVIQPTDISVDPESGHIFVLDMYRTIKEFDTNGKSVSSISFQEPERYLVRLGDGFLMFEPNMTDSTEKLLTFMRGNKTESMLDKVFKGPFYAETSAFTYAANGVVLVNSIFSDTVYAFSAEDETISPVYCFDFEGRGINRPDRLDGMRDLGEYLRTVRENRLFSGVMNFNYYGNLLFFSVNEEGKTSFCMYNSADYTFMHSDRLFEDLPNNYVRAGTTEGYTIFTYDAPWLVEYFDEHEPTTQKGQKLRSNLSEDDNPVIVVAKLKP